MIILESKLVWILFSVRQWNVERVFEWYSALSFKVQQYALRYIHKVFFVGLFLGRSLSFERISITDAFVYIRKKFCINKNIMPG